MPRAQRARPYHFVELNRQSPTGPEPQLRFWNASPSIVVAALALVRSRVAMWKFVQRGKIQWWKGCVSVCTPLEIDLAKHSIETPFSLPTIPSSGALVPRFSAGPAVVSDAGMPRSEERRAG